MINMVLYLFILSVYAMDLKLDTIDWSTTIIMIEKYKTSPELTSQLGVSTQAIGQWRRGVQSPALRSAFGLFQIIIELFMDDEKKRGSVDGYFDELNDLLPRKGKRPNPRLFLDH